MFSQLVSGFYLVFRQWGLFGVFISMFLENVAFPLPIEIGYLSGIYLIDIGAYPYWVVIFALTAGHMAGATCAYAIGKYAKPWLDRKFKNSSAFLGAEEKIHAWYQRFGDGTAFFVRFLGYVRLFSSYIAGIAEYRFWRFIAFTTLGSLLFNIFGMSVSRVLIDVWKKYASLHIYIVFAMSISFFVFIGWGIMQKRKRAHTINIPSPNE